MNDSLKALEKVAGLVQKSLWRSRFGEKPAEE
jgi:hypothetical protein